MTDRKHLRAVPDHDEPTDPVEHQVEEVGEAVARAAQAEQGGSLDPAQPARFVPRRSLASLGSTSSETFGTLADWGTHALTVTGAAGSGALVGGVAAGSWRGAGLGAASNVAMLGFLSAILGGGRLPTSARISYGVLGVASAAFVGWMLWRRWR